MPCHRTCHISYKQSTIVVYLIFPRLWLAWNLKGSVRHGSTLAFALRGLLVWMVNDFCGENDELHYLAYRPSWKW